MQQYLVFFLVLATATIFNPARAIDFECVNSVDCGAGNCCVLGMQPYSIPSCNPLGAVGDTCRPFNAPFNTTVSYPNGEEVDLTNIYLLYCVCAEGLVCSTDGSNSCQEE